METLRDLEIVRAMPAKTGPVLRAKDDDTETTGLGRLTVRFSPFDQWYEVASFFEGNFMERTKRGAFAKTIHDNRDGVKVLFDHGYDPTIGNKVLMPVDDLREDPDSAVVEGDLFDTTYNRDLEPGLRAGSYGSSFRFRVTKEEWDDEPKPTKANPKGIPERTITEAWLYEAGPVTFPANPAATSKLRSTTDDYYRRLRAQAPDQYEELRARAIALHGTTGDTGPDGAALQGPGEQRKHSDGMTPRERRAVMFSIPGRV